MELNQLRYFLELSRFQNVSAAAEHLNISQPALSKTIGLLESELGVQLFDRVGRRIRINEHGRLFADYAERTLATLQEGVGTVRSLEYVPSGTITLGLFAYIDVIAGCLDAFLQKYPLVSISLYSSKTQYTVEHFDRLDFSLSSSLTTANLPRDDYTSSFELARESYVLTAAPELLEQYAPGIPIDELRLADLKDLPFLTMANNLLFTDVSVLLCQQAGFSPRQVLRTNDFATKLTMVSRGAVAAFIPQVCIPTFRARRPDLVFLPLPDLSSERVIRLSRKKTALTSRACDVFWDFAVDYFKNKNTEDMVSF